MKIAKTLLKLIYLAVVALYAYGNIEMLWRIKLFSTIFVQVANVYFVIVWLQYLFGIKMNLAQAMLLVVIALGFFYFSTPFTLVEVFTNMSLYIAIYLIQVAIIAVPPFILGGSIIKNRIYGS